MASKAQDYGLQNLSLGIQCSHLAEGYRIPLHTHQLILGNEKLRIRTMAANHLVARKSIPKPLRRQPKMNTG
jgi:hypothetical protein